MNDLKTSATVAKKVATATENKNEPKTAEVQKIEIPKVLQTTADQRIKKLENFQILAKKHSFLKGKLDELSAFLLGRDGLKEKLTLENGEGEEFKISNSVIISKILLLAEAELLQMTEQSEKEILNFSI